VPVLLDRVKPVHEVIPVEYYLPGCPPPADRIRSLLAQLLEGRPAQLTASEIRFG
jgi:NAD-reducing hydrogenase small subunit